MFDNARENGFLFSKEQLNYSQTCQLSSFQQQHQQWEATSSSHSHCRLEMSKGRFPTSETSLSKRLRQPHSNWARRPTTKWAWCPTINGQGVPQQKGMASLKASSTLEEIWSKPSFPTDARSSGKVRPRRPLIGWLEQQDGKSCHGMSPSWATYSFSGKHLQSQVGPNGPFFQRLQNSLPWWRKNTTSPGVLDLIMHGVNTSYPLPSSLSMQPCFRNQEETKLAWETIQEYLEVGAIKEIPLHQAKHIIPWFVIKKGDKLRLITNCKELNNYLEPKPFRLENWPEIFPYLRKGMWAAKIDLKHAYFHLHTAEGLRP